MSSTRAIILAGGRGTRLYPLTQVVGKHLQPVYNKPLIYYALTTVILAGIAEILIISSPEDLPLLQALLGDGRRWGVHIEYATQRKPAGIAEALQIGRRFTAGHRTLLMLGDNIIYGHLGFLRRAAAESDEGARIFAYPVSNPSAYGVVEFDASGRALSLEEKPTHPRSSWAVVGLYIYGGDAASRVDGLAPSARGELEITDLNRLYLSEGALHVHRLGRGVAWFDAGTAESLLEASGFVRAVETRQGACIGSPEEAAWQMGYLTYARFVETVGQMPECSYRQTLQRVIRDASARPGGDGSNT